MLRDTICSNGQGSTSNSQLHHPIQALDNDTHPTLYRKHAPSYLRNVTMGRSSCAGMKKCWRQLLSTLSSSRSCIEDRSSRGSCYIICSGCCSRHVMSSSTVEAHALHAAPVKIASMLLKERATV